ncbi:hypothetical Protein YC6258_04637 [Gynuella sunshinyii YC6258]|uniref:Uncharacterized protein n=2 Tax=Gynuella sunshinyii TaxID=1445505 RepID=A0A0C5W1X0_9GAMM|nr:hypothetical Protein YC6258_04637 [Gynuella sunshinyii YC6258]
MEGAFELNAVMDNNCILLKSNDGRITWKVNCQQFAGSLISALKTASRLFYEIGHPELTNGFNEGIKQVREALTKSFPR